jgi:hypothetical protein
MVSLPPDERLRVEAAALTQLRRRRRRLASACFFVAGIGFGTAIYLLRARAALLREPGRLSPFIALIALTASAFWLGARTEVEIGQLEERLRTIEEELLSRRRR